MNKLEQAARQALEALREYRDTQMISAPRKAIEALREALAEQAEQEPFDMNDHPPHRLCECRKCMEYFTPLPDCDAFAASGKPIAEQEPVAWHHPQCEGQCIACLIEKAVQDAYGTQGRDYMLRHINAAPVRTKDLTDDEIEECVHIADSECTEDACMPWFIEFARAVIAADREKNNANNNS